MGFPCVRALCAGLYGKVKKKLNGKSEQESHWENEQESGSERGILREGEPEMESQYEIENEWESEKVRESETNKDGLDHKTKGRRVSYNLNCRRCPLTVFVFRSPGIVGKTK